MSDSRKYEVNPEIDLSKCFLWQYDEGGNLRTILQNEVSLQKNETDSVVLNFRNSVTEFPFYDPILYLQTKE